MIIPTVFINVKIAVKLSYSTSSEKESESTQCRIRTVRFNTVLFSRSGIEVRHDYQTVNAKDVKRA